MENFVSEQGTLTTLEQRRHQTIHAVHQSRLVDGTVGGGCRILELAGTLLCHRLDHVERLGWERRDGRTENVQRLEVLPNGILRGIGQLRVPQTRNVHVV